MYRLESFFSFSSRIIHSAFIIFLLLIFVSGHAVAVTKNSEEIRAEAFVSDTDPFLQQTVLYTVRIYHPANVRELNLSPINAVGFSLERIGEPPMTTRRVGRKGQMISDFRYLMTPLVKGKMEIPAAHIKVVSSKQQDSQWNYYQDKRQTSEVSTRPLTLEVRPVANLDHRWIPLSGLQIRAYIDRRQAPQVGEPITLTLVQTAWGGDGDHLPNLASLLKSPDFNIYPDKSETSHRLSPNGKELQGRRIETVTLIPQRSGRIEIPALKVAWWNINQDRQEWSEWPGMSLEIQPGANSVTQTQPAAVAEQNEDAWHIGWLIFLSLSSFLLGWWMRAGLPVFKLLRASYHSLSARLRRYWQMLVNRIHPATTGTVLQGSMPSSVQLPRKPGVRAITWLASWIDNRTSSMRPLWLHTWLLRRRIARYTEPRAIEHDLQIYARQALGLPDNAALHKIGEVLAERYPRKKQARLTELLHALDASMYSDDESVTLEDWKRDFCKVLRGAGFRRSQHRVARYTLPALNPDYMSIHKA
ncbi:MAG: hypothetical protein EP297_15655 [Gammaproteobacteria bacterium]|nr:MAG: hypothetical protein EP297_15655 [Gammaproteobacteria bacterium]